MLSTATPRRVSKPQTQTVAYAKALSRVPAHRGWMPSTHSPRPVHKVVRKVNSPALLGNASEAVFLDYQSFCAQQLDDLAADGLDWISLLPLGSALEILNLSLLGVEACSSAWLKAALPVEKLVKLTQTAKHYSVCCSGSMCWSYTCCLQLADIGRVRFVVCRQTDGAADKYAAFITNRLDWSPRKVISQSLQLSTLPNLLKASSALFAESF